tara:strand:- start:1476 stop:1910 length:435 start_codon:yes stop_codon:yes gene_type:complete
MDRFTNPTFCSAASTFLEISSRSVGETLRFGFKEGMTTRPRRSECLAASHDEIILTRSDFVFGSPSTGLFEAAFLAWTFFPALVPRRDFFESCPMTRTDYVNRLKSPLAESKVNVIHFAVRAAVTRPGIRPFSKPDRSLVGSHL